MGSRRFEITVVSAGDLPDVRLIGRMKVYAVIALNGAMVGCTHTDEEGKTNPRWNSTFGFPINEADLRRPGLNIAVELYCERTLGDRYVGRTVIPVKSLFDRGLRSQCVLSFPIEGTCCGRLNIRYWFEEKYPPSKRNESKGGGDVLWTVARAAWFLHTGDFSSFLN